MAFCSGFTRKYPSFKNISSLKPISYRISFIPTQRNRRKKANMERKEKFKDRFFFLIVFYDNSFLAFFLPHNLLLYTPMLHELSYLTLTKVSSVLLYWDNLFPSVARELAKRLGEEAGTKLLAPMMILLILVLFLVLVPAFTSFY